MIELESRKAKATVTALSIALIISLATSVIVLGTGTANTAKSTGLQKGLFNDASAASQCENMPVLKITGSADSTRSPSYSIDSNLSTSWTAEGVGSWVKPDIGEIKVVCYVDIIWYEGNSRVYSFEISTSEDGATWKTVYTGKSTGKTSNYERYNFVDTSARWVMIKVFGNQWNDWNDITELDVYGFVPLTDTNPPYVQITDPKDGSTLISSTTKITVQGIASDDASGIKIVEVRVDNGAYVAAVPKALNDWSSWSVPIDLVAPGTHRLVPRATDNAGNQAWNSIYVTLQEQNADTAGTKYFMATMLQYVDTNKQVDIYKPNMITSDKGRIHVGLNNQVIDSQLSGLISLPGSHGMEFFSLSEIKTNAPILKAKGLNFIDYDLEPGTGHSPYSDLADPVASIRAASKAAHDNGLLFQCSPSKQITTDHGAELAPYCDQYHIQAQSLQGSPDQYESFVKSTAAKLRNSNPNIMISVQLSTQRESASGMTLLGTMEYDFGHVSSHVDGVSLWFSNTDSALSVVKSFAEWFDTNYH